MVEEYCYGVTNLRAVPTVTILLLVAACSSSDIVYRDRPPFNPAPDSVSGLLGYYSVSTKQTTCGNCHAGHQADWSATKHANAFQTLVSSGVATPACYSCHTLNEHGNGLPPPRAEPQE